jgi:hypothetical protein
MAGTSGAPVPTAAEHQKALKSMSAFFALLVTMLNINIGHLFVEQQSAQQQQLKHAHKESEKKADKAANERKKQAVKQEKEVRVV